MEERSYKVYVHTNKINGKIYCGITKQIPKYRWKKDGKGYSKKDNAYFYNAIKKYGWDNFDHEIIASNLTKEEAENFEIKLIGELDLTNRDKGYNIQHGGNTTGTHSDEVKNKLSKLKKGIPTGLCGELSAVSKSVDVYNMDGEYIETTESVSEAAIKYGSEISNVSYCCSGRIKTSNGLVFRFSGEPFDKYCVEHKTKAKGVMCIDIKTGNILKTYRSVTDAAIDTNTSRSLIVRYCKNRVKKKNGYDWVYLKELNKEKK